MSDIRIVANPKMKTSVLILTVLIATLEGCRPTHKPYFTEEKMDSILLSEFTPKWKNDSLGKNGFRVHQYTWDSIARIRRINGLNFQGYSETQITKWLGHPSSRGRHFEDNGLIMEYPVQQEDKLADKALLIYFGRDDKVVAVVEKVGMPK
jgi:hypothetical protein